MSFAMVVLDAAFNRRVRVVEGCGAPAVCFSRRAGVYSVCTPVVASRENLRIEV
jgi:hypothetical protein